MKDTASIQVENTSAEEKFLSRAYFIRTLLNGIIFILPTIVILFLFSLIFKFVFNLVSPISSLLDKNGEKNELIINVLALLILFALIFIMGLFTRNSRGKRTFRRFENKYLLQLPLYTTVKETIAQFSGIKKMPFSQVVLVDAYNTGVLLTGFISENAAEGIYTVFVPTAPNPMNGNIYHVPATQLRFLDIEPEKAMRSIVGMGTGSSILFTSKERIPDF